MALISLEYYLKFKGNTEKTTGELKMESFKESSGKDTERRDIGLCLTLKVIRLVKVGQGEKEGVQTEKAKLRVWPVLGKRRQRR